MCGGLGCLHAKIADDTGGRDQAAHDWVRCWSLP